MIEADRGIINVVRGADRVLLVDFSQRLAGISFGDHSNGSLIVFCRVILCPVSPSFGKHCHGTAGERLMVDL